MLMMSNQKCVPEFLSGWLYGYPTFDNTNEQTAFALISVTPFNISLISSCDNEDFLFPPFTVPDFHYYILMPTLHPNS